MPDTLPPNVALDGSVQPLYEPWDPYAPPSAPPAAPIQPPPAYGPAPAGPMFDGQMPGFVGQAIRVLQRIEFNYTYLGGNSGQELGFSTAELYGTFAVPVLPDTDPLLVTPGFALHWLDGPETFNFPSLPDLPAQLYEGYLEFGWRPRVTPWLSGDLAVKPGVFTDFDHFTDDSIRILGRGLAIFSLNSQFQVVLGVLYLDRLRVKLLPAAGFIWSPNVDSRYEVVFPRPKLAHRVVTWGNFDIWWYVAGEYGGGSWTIERASGAKDQIDYNDIRLYLGLESVDLANHKLFVEAGWVFEREVIYRKSDADFDPDDTFMLRAGIVY